MLEGGGRGGGWPWYLWSVVADCGGGMDELLGGLKVARRV